MQKLLRSFKRTFSVAGVLLTVWFLPSELARVRSEEVTGPWRQVLALLDQKTALWLAALGFGGWIVWTDVRPLVSRMRRRRIPILPLADFHWVTRPVQGEDGNFIKELYAVDVFLQVVKGADGKGVIRGLTANVALAGEQRPLRLRRSQEIRSDLRDGEIVYFHFGRFFSTAMIGPCDVEHPYVPDYVDKAQLEKNFWNGFILFRLMTVPTQHHILCWPGMPTDRPLVNIVFSADDTEPTIAAVSFDLQKLPDLNRALRVGLVLQS